MVLLVPAVMRQAIEKKERTLMRRHWKTLAAMCVVAIAATASIAVAAPRHGSSSSSSTDTTRPERGPAGPRGDLTALAKQLDVSTSKLRSALDAVRKDLGPPARPPQQPPTRQQMEQRCTAATDALGQQLGKSGDAVRSALKQVATDRLAAAVKAGRLTSAQADQIRQRIDSSPCLPIGRGGPGGPGGHGCHGGGHRGFGPDGPPPGRPNGSDGSGSGSGTSAPSFAPSTEVGTQSI
jgi:hypothetical protein